MKTRRFEVANKVVDGKGLMRYDEATGTETPVKWDVADECLPVYKTEHAAGADFCAAEDTVIPSIWKAWQSATVSGAKGLGNWLTDLIENNGKSESTISDEMRKSTEKMFRPTLVHTGIKCKLEEDEVLEIYNRSSGPKKGLVLANSVGIIDADYYGCDATDGEIMFAFYNFMPFDITIKKGDAIGQGLIKKFIRADVAVTVSGEEKSTLTITERTGGFGSTNLNNLL